MLPKSRILSALIVGVGIALIVAGLVAPRFLLGDARFPLNLEHTTWAMHDPHGRVFDPDAGEDGKVVEVPVTRQLHMTVQNPATEERTGLRIGDSLLRGDKDSDFDNLITASTWSYEMDRKSGAFVTTANLSTVMAMPDAEVPVDGVWLKFPLDVEQTDYAVFEPSLRTTVPATFKEEREVAGRSVYVFEQRVEAVNVAKLYADAANTKTLPAPDGGQRQVFRHHDATREFTVDQITGVVVGINERVDDYYADHTGRRAQDIVAYDAVMDPADVEQMAGQLTTVTQSVSRWVTWGTIGLGSLLAIGGLIGALRPGRGRSAQVTS
ncbi:DUF3068 domain-containing protein [Corynebacterium sp. CCUG 70398]|uniref:DUF3068 domain-containing protein n=1 Tax=Corynebacterium sp. CCUG 70398 TaxID=2823891 RepID=UPI002108744C|nr:DUF3068 domain-containing protein [Corynebacterium sp. CCUG 70398]MCQ4622483.1 DUF3068 domain-containing protein [Corynebacterium sp. CCUG 70398]